MSLSKERVDIYLKEREQRDNGIPNGIPLYYTFPKLGSVIKTIPKGYPILWTANSGIGKTQTWIGIFVYTLYYIKKHHPELNIKIKLVVALLEDTKEMFIDRLHSMLFYNLYGIVVDSDELHSRGMVAMRKEVADKLDGVIKEADSVLEDCEIVDSIYNPTGLYKWARTISNKLGAHKNKNMIFTDEHGNESNREVYSHYEQHDPTVQVLMVVDNLNNLSQEMREGRLLSERETINAWTRSYCRLQITKHWGWSVVNIIQQAADSESQQFSLISGKNIIDKVKPSLSGLGNSKECQRDHFIVIGIFAPDRYGIDLYEKYDISKLGDNFRSLIVLKSNLSITNVEIPYYFNGACSLLRELPKPDDMSFQYYANIQTIMLPQIK